MRSPSQHISLWCRFVECVIGDWPVVVMATAHNMPKMAVPILIGLPVGAKMISSWGQAMQRGTAAMRVMEILGIGDHVADERSVMTTDTFPGPFGARGRYRIWTHRHPTMCKARPEDAQL